MESEYEKVEYTKLLKNQLKLPDCRNRYKIMAIEKVKMFTDVYDNCKLHIGIKDEYSCWNDENSAKENAMNSDWLIHYKHYYPDCYDFDDNDKLIIKTERKDKYDE